MEDPDRQLWPFRLLSFKSKSKTERLSKEQQGVKPAQAVEGDLAPLEQLEGPRSFRKPSFGFNLQKNFNRFRRLKQILPQLQRDQQLPSLRERLLRGLKSPIPQQYLPDREPLLGLPINEDMSLVEKPAERNNGSPVRPQRQVIDLTSDDEDEDEYSEDAQDITRIKIERHEAVGPGQARKGDGVRELGLAERAASPPNAYVRPRDVWGDFDLDDEFGDAFLAQPFHMVPANAYHPPHPVDRPHLPDPVLAPASPVAPAFRVVSPVQAYVPEGIMESRTDCVESILTVFPGICGDYVSKLCDTVSQSSAALIAHILDKVEKGSDYPTAKEKQQKKRKREVDEDAEAARKYGAPDRVISSAPGGIRTYITKILSHEFPLTEMKFINATLGQTGYRLFSAYQVLEEAERTWPRGNPSYKKLKNPRKDEGFFTNKAIADYLAAPAVDQQAGDFIDHQKTEVFQELQAARRIRSKAVAQRAAERQAEIAEEENVSKAEAEGTMAECQCCCCDYPLNRMVHCNGETLHWFCRGCAKQTAEVEIGKSKYELICMSTDKCSAGFSHDQRAQFLDDNTRVALERNEQEAMLRLAGIENLESCPFCPFAMEYPDVAIDREFRCQAPDCERTSCRLCRLESHIPKTCEEHAKDSGLSLRRLIEEAMSAAMIRKCNKCGTPFVKEEGCNKMTCTRKGCRNIQCYVCSTSCGYDHFNDPSRGGKEGNCPLFENSEERHDEEVKKAEKDALEKVLAEHPEYSEEDLKVKMSENVQKDDEARKTKDPRAARYQFVPGGQGQGNLLPVDQYREQQLRFLGQEMARQRILVAQRFRAAFPEVPEVGQDDLAFHRARDAALYPRPIPAPAPLRRVGGHANPANVPAQQPAESIVPPVVNPGAPAPARQFLGAARERLRLRGRRNRDDVEVQNRHEADMAELRRQIDDMRQAAQRQRLADPMGGRMGAKVDARLVADEAVHANNRKVDIKVPGPENSNADRHRAMMQGLAAPALGVERNLPYLARRDQTLGQDLQDAEREIIFAEQDAIAAGRDPATAAPRARLNHQLVSNLNRQMAQIRANDAALAGAPAPALAAQENPQANLGAAQRQNFYLQFFQRWKILVADNREDAVARGRPWAQAPPIQENPNKAGLPKQSLLPNQTVNANAAAAQPPPQASPAKQNPENPRAAAQRRDREYQLWHRNMIRANLRDDAAAQGDLWDPFGLPDGPQLEEERANMPNQLLQQHPPPPYVEDDAVMQDAGPPPPYLPQFRQRIQNTRSRGEQQVIANRPPPPKLAPEPNDNPAALMLCQREMQRERQIQLQNMTRRIEATRRHVYDRTQIQVRQQQQAHDPRLIFSQQQEAPARTQAELHRNPQAQARALQQIQAQQAQREAQRIAQVEALRVRVLNATANGLPADGERAFVGRARFAHPNAAGIDGLLGVGGGYGNGNAVGAGNRARARGEGNENLSIAESRAHHPQAEMDRYVRMSDLMRKNLFVEAADVGDVDIYEEFQGLHVPEEMEEEYDEEFEDLL